jgi:sugar lactone lactonase YvrE
MDECRPGGRLFELYPHSGRAPRLIAGNLPLPNALMVGPDNRIYFPEVVAGEVWRVPVEGGTPERVAAGLATPVAVKFNRRGELTVPQAGNGEIVRIDVQSGAKTVLAKIRPGIDNLAFSPDNRLFVSHFIDGGVAEVATDGSNAERILVAAGLLGPWGLACGAGGTLYAADGGSFAAISATGSVTRLGMLLEEGSPGFLRGLAAAASGELYVTTSGGGVASYHPVSRASAVLTSGLNELYGLACAADGTLVVAEGGEGRILGINPATKEVSVLARGLSRPTGIVVGSDGSCCVSEAGKGRVVRIDSRGTITPIVEGLKEPQGLAVLGNQLLILDAGTKDLQAVHLTTGQRQVIASNLAIGAPPGVVPKPLMGVPDLVPGPLSAFAGLTVGADGTIYIAADGEGSVLMLRKAS